MNRRGAPMKADSKSEQAVLMREQGKSYREIAVVLGSSENTLRVLVWKRRNITKRLLAGREE